MDRLGVHVAVMCELEVLRRDDDVTIRELAELAQFLGRERRLGRAASAEHRDLTDLRVGECLQRMLCDVGPMQVLHRYQQDACDIHGDVAVPDDHRARAREVEGHRAIVGMRVVPADEIRGRVGPGQMLLRDPEPPVSPRADRVDDGMVVGLQVLMGQLPADLDVAVEAELRVRGDLVVDAGDRLDLRVIGCDTTAHEAERRWQSVEHVDLHDQVILALQEVRGIETGGARADYGDPQRTGVAAQPVVRQVRVLLRGVRPCR